MLQGGGGAGAPQFHSRNGDGTLRGRAARAFQFTANDPRFARSTLRVRFAGCPLLVGLHPPPPGCRPSRVMLADEFAARIGAPDARSSGRHTPTGSPRGGA